MSLGRETGGQETNRLQKKYSTWMGATIENPDSKCNPEDIARRRASFAISKSS